jgi:hypothetical protein
MAEMEKTIRAKIKRNEEIAAANDKLREDFKE